MVSEFNFRSDNPGSFPARERIKFSFFFFRVLMKKHVKGTEGRGFVMKCGERPLEGRDM